MSTIIKQRKSKAYQKDNSQSLHKIIIANFVVIGLDGVGTQFLYYHIRVCVLFIFIMFLYI